MNNMKDYRGKELLCFLIGNLIVALYFCDDFRLVFDGKIDKVVEFLTILVRCSLVFSFLGLLIFILDVFVSETQKNKFVSMVGGLPGDNIFTNIKDCGDKWGRFTAEDARKKYKHIYEEMSEQGKSFKENPAWYKIYQKHKDEGSVWNSQRDFLLVRDMCILLIWLIVLYALLSCICSGSFYSGWPLLIYVVELIVFYIVQHRKATRFVYNVIANDIHEMTEPLGDEFGSYVVQVKRIE